MSSLIDDFERQCANAGLTPSAVFRAAGLNPSTWFRWRRRDVSPTIRSLEAAQAALLGMIEAAAARSVAPNMAPDGVRGAENPERNVSRTNEPGSSLDGAAA